jgi:integrase
MRDRGQGAVYPYKKGYAGQVELGPDVDGKRRRKTVYGPTKRSVEIKVQALLRQLDEHGDLPTSETTVEKWLTTWLEDFARPRLKPNTYRSYRTAVTQHIVPAIGKVKLGSLAPAHVRAMHRKITATQSRKGTLSTTTALNAHRILSVALNDAVREGVVPTNKAALVRAPSKAVSTRRGMTAKEAVTLLQSSADTRWLFALTTGTRQGERLGLRWDYLDLDAGIADLAWALQRVPFAHGCGGGCGRRPQSCPEKRPAVPAGMEWDPLDGGNIVLMRPKTKGSQRVIALMEPVRLALQAMKEHAYPSPYDLVWTDDSKPIDPRDDWQDWKDALKAAGLPDFAQHATRHTAATLMLEAGESAKVIEEMLGHSSAVTTRAYQHVSLELQREAVNRLGQRLKLT